jgi:hypothetical protein
MTRVFDGDRPAHIGLPPVVIARQRSELMDNPIDQGRFMSAFARARTAELRGDHRLYHWYRAALDADDSVVVAGYIEGAASAHTGRTGR